MDPSEPLDRHKSQVMVFAGIRRLLPGHLLVWQEGQIEVRRYWDIGPAQPEPRPDADHIERIDNQKDIDQRLTGISHLYEYILVYLFHY